MKLFEDYYEEEKKDDPKSPVANAATASARMLDDLAKKQEETQAAQAKITIEIGKKIVELEKKVNFIMENVEFGNQMTVRPLKKFYETYQKIKDCKPK